MQISSGSEQFKLTESHFMGRILSFLKYLENFLRLLNSQCLDIWDREHLSRERGYCRRCAQLCLVRLRLRHFLTDIVPASVVSNKFIQICYDINVLAIYLHCSEIEAKYFKDFEHVNLKCSISCFSFHRLYVCKSLLDYLLQAREVLFQVVVK